MDYQENVNRLAVEYFQAQCDDTKLLIKDKLWIAVFEMIAGVDVGFIPEGLDNPFDKVDNLALTETLNDCLKYVDINEGEFTHYFNRSYTRRARTNEGKEKTDIMHAGIKMPEEERKQIYAWYHAWKENKKEKNKKGKKSVHPDEFDAEHDQDKDDDADDETYVLNIDAYSNGCTDLDRKSTTDIMRNISKGLENASHGAKTPSNEEREAFAKSSGISLDLINTYFSSSISLDWQLSYDDSESSTGTVGDLQADPYEDIERLAINKTRMNGVWDLIQTVFDGLQDRTKPKMRKIITGSIIIPCVEEGLDVEDLRNRNYFDDEVWNLYLSTGEVSQKDIAEMLGLLEEAVSRDLRVFREKILNAEEGR